MYRIVDNKDASTLAIVFSENIAKKLLAGLPKEIMENNEDFSRFEYEDCSNLSLEEFGFLLKKIGNALTKRKF